MSWRGSSERAAIRNDAAKPNAKSAWESVRDGSVKFGQSVKTFFTRLFGNSS